MQAGDGIALSKCAILYFFSDALKPTIAKGVRYMEVALNIVWTVLAAVMIWLWISNARREGVDRWTQPVALFVCLLILFPAISLTDDLLAIQNPTIADAFDNCFRRDHNIVGPHTNSPAVATLPPPIFSELYFGSLCSALSLILPIQLSDNPALTSIQNRPPPVA